MVARRRELSEMDVAQQLTRAQRIRRKNVRWLFGLLSAVAILYVVFMMRAAQF